MKRANAKLNAVMMVAGLVVLSFPVFAQTSDGIPMGEIRQACEHYLNAYANRSEIQKMDKKLRDQVATKVSDSNLDEDTAMRHIMLDWSHSALQNHPGIGTSKPPAQSPKMVP